MGGRLQRPAHGPAAAEYDAFISYSHAADGRLAPALQVGVAVLTLLALWTLDLSRLGVLLVLAVATGLAFAVRRVHPPAPDVGLVPAP